MPFFRYPGGKRQLKRTICEHLRVYSAEYGMEFREPFFGGGSVGLEFLETNPNWRDIWINDKDISLATLWTTVIEDPEPLIPLVMDFTPSIAAFDQLKAEFMNPEFVMNCDPLTLSFKKLVIHQISFSGLATKGGPQGGRRQGSEHTISCRWSPENICKKVRKDHQILSRHNLRENKCTNVDFSEVIRSPGHAVIYLDPPYYIKGNSLYYHGFTKQDHLRLAEELFNTPNPWILSYDDCPEIRELYKWAEIQSVLVNHSINTARDSSGKKKKNKQPELLIFSKNHMEITDVLRNVSA